MRPRENLPEALAPLAAYNQFILRKGKIPCGPLTKKPINPLSPTNWMDVQTALAWATHFSSDFGIGFVFTADDPYFFIDIDNCLLKDKQWSSTALELCQQMSGAAVEVSQSGKGLHIFGTYQGVAPAHRCKNKELGLEMYTEKRFVALTGTKVIGSAATDCTARLPGIVAEYFAPLDHIDEKLENWRREPVPEWSGPEDDDELLQKMMRSGGVKAAFGSRASFSELWTNNEEALAIAFPSQNPTDPYDRSSADAAVVQHLAFWTGKNHERVHRLMLQSKLVREKWTKHRTYLQRTITRAVSRQTDVYNAQSPIRQETEANPILTRELRTTLASDVTPRIIEWVWEGVLPLGKIVMLAGDPGVGKGILTVLMASRISTGKDWKLGQPCRRGTVAFLAQEDGKEDTVVPRLMAAGADLDRVKFIDGVAVPNIEGDIPFNLEQSSVLLDSWLKKNPDVIVLFIDPINDFLGPNTDSYKDAEVRYILNPLKIMAEKHGVTIVMISHMNKGNTKASYRIMGAMAFTGVARMTFIVTKSKDDPDLRMILPVKANIAKDVAGIGFRVREHQISIGPIKSTQPVAVLDVLPVNMTAEEALNGIGSGDNLDSDIEDFLYVELGEGPVLANEMKDRCENAGLSYATVRKRKKRFGVISYKRDASDTKSPWEWKLRSPTIDNRSGGPV